MKGLKGAEVNEACGKLLQLAQIPCLQRVTMEPLSELRFAPSSDAGGSSREQSTHGGNWGVAA